MSPIYYRIAADHHQIASRRCKLLFPALSIEIMMHLYPYLLFWRAHEVKYPRLAQLALEYIAIPISSVPVECLFSTDHE